jgi:hypothetical protein
MPIGITEKIKERKQTILKLLADGCKTTAHVMRALDLTHTEAFYTLKMLASEGYVKRAMFGKTSIWCLNDVHYEKLVNTLLREIQRVVESHNLKYVYPTRLYKLILKDPQAYKLISQYMPINGNNSQTRRFLNHLLNMIYGPPYYVGEKVVYITNRSQRPTA